MVVVTAAVVVADAVNKAAQGYRSIIAFPLLNKGIPFGVLTIHAEERNAFDPQTVALLTELADDLAFGILGLRSRHAGKLAAEDLRESEEQLKTIASSARDAIIKIDNDGKVVFWNEAAVRMFGYGVDEAMGKEVHRIIAPEHYFPLYLEHFASFRVTGEGPVIGKCIELTARNKEGREFPAELSVSAVKVHDRWAAIAIARDITERKLTEERLHQADKMDALGNLAGGIAHDLRNMLFPVLSLTGMTIKELPEGSRQRQRLDRVLQAAERARTLVEKIHAFSHEEAPSRQVVEVAPLLTEAMGLILPALPATISVTECRGCRPGLKVEVDCAQFDTILMNLASNAVDALGGRPGVLSFTCSEIEVDKALVASILLPAEGPYLKYSVTDTGPGMDQETCRRVFDPWFSTKPKGEGTGLGLAVVKKIIAEHGGAITVASELGKGTTFEIYLPIAAE